MITKICSKCDRELPKVNCVKRGITQIYNPFGKETILQRGQFILMEKKNERSKQRC